MDALIASYADSDSDADSPPPPPISSTSSTISPLPPPPLSLLNPPNSNPHGTDDWSGTQRPGRVRSYPHVDGNYALHVSIPVLIPQSVKKDLARFLRRISFHVPDLSVVDADIALDILRDDEQRFERFALEKEFHISLGRTVPIRVHQIDSMVTLLRQKLLSQKRYWIDFNRWEVFVNDDGTRTFLSMEVVGQGLTEIKKQIQAVNHAYRLHNLPEFYENPRPHISLVWASSDVRDSLLRAVAEETKKCADAAGSLQKRIFTVKFSGIQCKIGQKTYKICKVPGN